MPLIKVSVLSLKISSTSSFLKICEDNTSDEVELDLSEENSDIKDKKKKNEKESTRKNEEIKEKNKKMDFSSNDSGNSDSDKSSDNKQIIIVIRI